MEGYITVKTSVQLQLWGVLEWQGVPACCMRQRSVMLCLEFIFEHKLCAGLHTRTRPLFGCASVYADEGTGAAGAAVVIMS